MDNSPSLIFSKRTHILFFILTGAALFVAGLAIATVQGAYDKDFPEHSHLKLSETQHNELDKDIGDAAVTMKTFVNTQINSLNQTIIDNTSEAKKNKDEITAVKVDIKNKFPQASDVTDTGSSVISNTPFLTLTIDKTSYIPGETIVFTGTANPDTTVIINIQKYGGCSAKDICAAWVMADKNGQFRLEFETEFDDPVGAWKAYVKVGEDRSQTIVFEVAK